METKEQFILNTLHNFRHVAAKLARIEEMPIMVTPDFTVTTREAHTIKAIGLKQPLNVTDVATEFGITRSAASQMVSRLCGKGLLEKKVAPHSEKEFQLSLTSLGVQVFDAHKRLHGVDQDFIVERMSGFSLSQIATVAVFLEAIEEVLDSRIASRAK